MLMKDHASYREISSSKFKEQAEITFLKFFKPENVGRGGSLVEEITFNRRVVGSTPALAAS